MGWPSEWKNISARINSLLDAGHYHASMMKILTFDDSGGGGVLLRSASEKFRVVERLQGQYEKQLFTEAAPARAARGTNLSFSLGLRRVRRRGQPRRRTLVPQNYWHGAAPSCILMSPPAIKQGSFQLPKASRRLEPRA